MAIATDAVQAETVQRSECLARQPIDRIGVTSHSSTVPSGVECRFQVPIPHPEAAWGRNRNSKLEILNPKQI
jgi:hypothetical protein